MISVGLSDLYNKTFTLINQIPTSMDNASKKEWVKHIMPFCDKTGGILDKSNGYMVMKSNAFTAYIRDFENYREPHFGKDGYYSLYKTNNSLYTANIGDLVIFREIEDETPKNISEFNALIQKYKNDGGILTAVESFINYNSDGTPWNTNHIELIKR